jgi:hypothetical protein
VDVARAKLEGHETGGAIVLEQDVQDEEFIEKGDVLFDALLEKSLKDHLAGAVRGIAGSAHGRLAEIPGVAAETPLVDPTVRGAVERQAEMLKIIDRADRFLGEDEGRFLVRKIISAFDRVEGMPLGFIFFDVTQGGADSALSGAGVRAHGMDFGNDSGLRFPPGLEGAVETGASRADNKDVIFVDQIHFPFAGSTPIFKISPREKNCKSLTFFFIMIYYFW